MRSSANILRSLYSQGDTFQCIAELLPRGLEARFLWAGQLMYSFLFATHDELRAWADEKRAEYLGKGWVDPGPGGRNEASH